MVTVKQLREKLAALGLSTEGKKLDVIRRLEDHCDKQPVISDDQCYQSGCNAILAATVEEGEDKDMVESSKDSLKAVIETDQIIVENIRDSRFVGNRHGLVFAEARIKADELESRMATMEKELTVLTSQIHQQDSQILQQGSKIHDLEHSAANYREFRNRFISSYKRDKQNTADDIDTAWIVGGNHAAHFGNSKIDMTLYDEPNPRKDYDAFISLYGIHPAVTILRLRANRMGAR